MVIKIHDCIKLLEIATCTWLTVVQTCRQHNAVETYHCCELTPNFPVLILYSRKWKGFLRPPPFLPLHVGVASHRCLKWERLAVWAGACTQVVYSVLQCTQNDLWMVAYSVVGGWACVLNPCFSPVPQFISYVASYECFLANEKAMKFDEIFKLFKSFFIAGNLWN